MGECRQGRLGEWLLAGQWRSGLQACFIRIGDNGSSRNLGKLIYGPGGWMEDGREIPGGESKREMMGILPVAWILWPLGPSRSPRTT